MGRESKYFLICGLQGAKPLTHGYGEGGWRLAAKGRASPSPEGGEAGRGQMCLRHLISTA